jgi:predicted transcriptional regulator
VNLTIREAVPDWLPHLLEQVEGIEAHRGSGFQSISVVVNGSRATNFDVYFLPVLSWEQAEELIRTWRDSGPNHARHHRMIATRHLSSATRELLREAGISWAEEGSGICRLSAPGLLVDTRVENVSQCQPTIRASLRDRSGLVAETLLLVFLHQEIRLAKLAKEANVSTALASRILGRLVKLKLLDAHKAGPMRFWRICDAGGLLDLWATEEQRTAQTTGLYVWGRSPQELLTKLPRLNQLTKRWALAGTAAANLYAPTLTTFPDPTIWVDSRVLVREVANALGGEIVDKGANLEVWQAKHNLAFAKSSIWTQANASANFGVPDLSIVSKPRAYIETVNQTGRAPEVAQSLRQRIISDGIA